MYDAQRQQLLWHLNIPLYAIVRTAREGEVWCTKEWQTLQGVADREVWGEKDERWGCFNKEERRRKTKREKGEETRKCTKIAKCKCAGRQNEKEDRKKGEEWKWKRAREKDCIEAVSVIFHCSTAIPANVPLQADCACAYLLPFKHPP